MIVNVFEDGHVWGRFESKQIWIAEGNSAALWPQQGRMAILKIPGVLAEKALSLLNTQLVDDAGVPVFTVFRRKEWKLVFDTLPLAVRNEVLSTGEYTTTVVAIRSFLRRIRDDAQYTGLD